MQDRTLETVKVVVEEIIEILQEEIAFAHRYTECGADPTEECLAGTCGCEYAHTCSTSHLVYTRLDALLYKLNEAPRAAREEMG